MKKQNALFGAILLLSPTLGLATSLTVQVQQAPLRSEPAFLSKIITHVGYRNSVEVKEERGAWRLVRFKQQEGWMHISALLSSALNLNAGQSLSDSISSKDVSLAGKGFTKEVEDAFKKHHRGISFAWVDKMEKVKVTSPELEKFAAGSDFSTVSR